VDEIKGCGEMRIISGIKNITKDLFYQSGVCKSLLWISRAYRCPALAILVYHRASPSHGDRGYMDIPENIFEGHVRFLKDNFKIVSMKEGLKNIYEKDSREIYAAINFDDGYMDNYLYAYPVLKRYSVPATIFLTTDYIGKRPVFWWDRVFNVISYPGLKYVNIDIGGSESIGFDLGNASQREAVTDRINGILRLRCEIQIQDIVGKLERMYPVPVEARPSAMLGWDEIRQMRASGIIFGSHTKTHRNLCLLKDDEIAEELSSSKKAIEKMLREEIREFSYPFGIFDERVKRLAMEAGFGYARAGLKRINRKAADRFLLASICAGALMKTSFLANRVSLSLFKD